MSVNKLYYILYDHVLCKTGLCFYSNQHISHVSGQHFVIFFVNIELTKVIRD